MANAGEEDAALSDFEDGDLEAAPVVLPNAAAEASAESLKAALLELDAERQARKAAETAKADLENSFSRLKGLAHEALKKRDDALRQKEEVLREKEEVAKQLDEALRLKEDAFKQRDEALRQRNELAKQKDEVVRLKDEAMKARDSSRSEIEAAAQMLMTGTEKITSKVSSIKNFIGGLPRSSKHTGLAAIAYGATKRAEEIVEELVRQLEITTKGRNDVREQMEQRSYQIAIEVSQLEATITGLRQELGNRSVESENLQKCVSEKDSRISELESELSDKVSQGVKELETLKRITMETEDKLKNAELKIEKQKSLASEQLICVSKAEESLESMMKMIDDTASDQLDLSEPLFVSQDLDIDKVFLDSLARAMFVSDLAATAEKKLRADQEKNLKDKKDLEDKITSLVAEKRDIGTLLRSALAEKMAAEHQRAVDGKKHTGPLQRKDEVLQVAERGLQNVGLELRGGALVGDPQSVAANEIATEHDASENGEIEVFSLASALENIIRTSQNEITELRHSLELSRAELHHLRCLSEDQAKDLTEKMLHIQELEERESTATENVEGLIMDIAAAEEEIARWREAAEQEAAAGKAVMEELQEEIVTLKRDLEEMRQSLDEANNKLMSKEEMASAAMTARDAAENSLRLADERASRLREKVEELTRQLEELDGKDDQQRLRRMRYACWPWHWLGVNAVGNYREAHKFSAEMELSDPLL